MADVTNEIMTNDKTKILSGEFLNFYTPRRQRIRSFKVYFSPKQEGSGTPSPENVRPISGWTGVDVQHCGKNLLETNINSYHHPSNAKIEPNDMIFTDGELSGTIISGQRDIGIFVYDNLLPPGTYTLSFDYINGVGNYYWKPCIIGKPSLAWTTSYKNIPVASNDSGHITTTFTAEEDFCINLSLNCFGNASKTAVNKIYNLQIELGSTATEYTPYKTNLLIPKEYQEVEYLESTGTQWIATNYAPENSPNAEWKCLELATDGENGLFGRNASSANRYFYDTYYGSVYIYRHKKVIRGNYRFVADFTKKPYEAIFTDNTLEVKNYGTRNLSGNISYSDTSGLPFYIFAINGAGAGWLPHHGARLYYLRFYENDTLSANFIPCYRKSDKVAGMYDAVSGQFYTNSGTGEFILGPAVNRYDIDWSEDVGTVYGGYVDLVSGELVETHELLQLNGAETSIREFDRGLSTHRFDFIIKYLPGQLKTRDDNWISDKLSYVSSKNSFGTYGFYSSSSLLIYDKDNEIADIEIFKQWLAENTPSFVAPLKEPIHHTLSTATLSTLMFDNNFWSNADRIEIEYDYIGVFDPIESRKNIFTATPHTATAKNSIVSFGTDMAADLRECKVWFLPKQDLHGYDKPWIGGSGKNLIPDRTDITFWQAGWLDSDGIVKPSNNKYITSDYIQVSPSDSYTLQLYEDFNERIVANWKCICFYDADKIVLPNYYSNNAVDELVVTVPENAKYMKVSFADRVNFPDSHFQLELGSTATAYEPYSNICPIEGWDSITVARVDRNLLDAENPDEDGFAYCYIPKGTVVVGSANHYTTQIRYYRKDKTQIDYWTMSWTSPYVPGRYYRSFTLKEDAYYWRCEYHNTTKGIKLQLEYGSSPTPYDISGTFITIPFPQTIYGGYVDLIKSEVVETYSIANEFSQYRQNNGFIAYRTAIDSTDKNKFYCNMIGKIGSFSSSNMNQNIIQTSRVGGSLFFALDENADINSLQLVYPRNTLNTYPIDSHTLTTLRGTNTIWSNSNSDVEITYWKHGDDSYQHVPSSPITSNDNFIIVTDDGYAIGEEDDFIVY